MMNKEEQKHLAAAFRERHRNGPILVLPNAFDVASARLFAARRPAAVGTTSSGIAWSSGYPDGERIGRDAMLEVVARIVRAVDVGVTADLEAGYGDEPEDVAVTTVAAIESGVIGLNLEDTGSAFGSQTGWLLDVPHAAAKLEAARAAAERADVPIVINARTDVFLVGAGENEQERIEMACDRGNRYLEAGADCVFVPGAISTKTIQALVEGISGSVNVYALRGLPAIEELSRLGVARISLGGGPYQACLALLDEIADAVLNEGDLEPLLRRQLAFPDAQALLAT